jgi:hypothetical protein
MIHKYRNLDAFIVAYIDMNSDHTERGADEEERDRPVVRDHRRPNGGGGGRQKAGHIPPHERVPHDETVCAYVRVWMGVCGWVRG